MRPITLKGLQTNPMLNGKLNTDNLQLLPKIALQYDFTTHSNIYASVTKGYRSGGYNVQMFSDLLQGEMTNGMIAAIDEKAEAWSARWEETRFLITLRILKMP